MSTLCVAGLSNQMGSMAKMVSRILEQEEGICVVLSTDRKTTHLIPTWQDIDVIQSIHQALSPLSSLTDMLSGESYVTVSAVLPIVHLIENNLLKEEESDTQLTKDIKCRIKGDLNSRYEGILAQSDSHQSNSFSPHAHKLCTWYCTRYLQFQASKYSVSHQTGKNH